MPLLLSTFLGFSPVVRGNDPINMSLGANGINLLGAVCGISYFPDGDIYQGVKDGIERLHRLQRDYPSLVKTYTPVAGQKLPLTGPYYKAPIYKSKTMVYRPGILHDFYVIFTGQGKLASVIYKIRDMNLSTTTFKDCDLKPWDTSPKRVRPYQRAESPPRMIPLN